jgi:ankyrin repeat protein
MKHQQRDEFGRSPLHYAAAEGDVAEVLELLRSGEDANLADHNGWTPLHFAAQASSALVIRALVGAGAKVDFRDGHGNTALSTATFNSRGKGDAIRALRIAGANPWALNNFGVSPAALARKIANYDIAQFFADLPAEAPSTSLSP